MDRFGQVRKNGDRPTKLDTKTAINTSSPFMDGLSVFKQDAPEDYLDASLVHVIDGNRVVVTFVPKIDGIPSEDILPVALVFQKSPDSPNYYSWLSECRCKNGDVHESIYNVMYFIKDSPRL
jgi:hypothetical protein